MVFFSHNRVIVPLLLLMIASGFWYWKSQPEPGQERYKTQAVDRGHIIQNISANGTLNPVVLVNVGTQVSGTVHRLYADFNDPVREGQILAELDPSLFKAQLRQAEANVANARVSLKLAESKMARNRTLRDEGFISPDALDVVEQQLEAARAQLAVNEAQLARDRTNLNYSVIRSPISGVVIARNVDVGQTVAASFQTPTLFQIAKDLRQMQIDTSVAEADIGQLHIGQTARFTVDAFQEREFAGTVEQVRLNPTIQQNVVSYNVIVSVSNDEGLLLPGMTANVRFTVNEKKDVLRAPNAALRYKPGKNGDSPPVPPRPGERMVYRLEDERSVPTRIRTGISDNSFTEITGGDIKEGDGLIIREISARDEPASKFRFRMF